MKESEMLSSEIIQDELSPPTRKTKRKESKSSSSKKISTPRKSAIETNYERFEKIFLPKLMEQESFSFSFEALDQYMDENPTANLVYILPLFAFTRTPSINVVKTFFDRERKAYSLYTTYGIEYLHKLQKTLAKSGKEVHPAIAEKLSKKWWRVSQQDTYKIRAAYEKSNQNEIIVTLKGFGEKAFTSKGEEVVIVEPKLSYDPVIYTPESSEDEKEEIEKVAEKAPEVEQPPKKKRKPSTPRKAKQSETEVETLKHGARVEIPEHSWLAFIESQKDYAFPQPPYQENIRNWLDDGVYQKYLDWTLTSIKDL